MGENLDIIEGFRYQGQFLVKVLHKKSSKRSKHLVLYDLAKLMCSALLYAKIKMELS